MTRNARLKQPDHQASSNKITYDTLKKTVIARDIDKSSSDVPDENKRVNITLTTKKQEKTVPQTKK